MLRACPHFLLTRACNSLSLAQTGQREGGRGEREIKREGEREKEGGRERERDVEFGCFILIFKRNDGCRGTF